MTLATGGTETTATVDGVNYKIHTFTTSGSLTVTEAGPVEYLIVAGGGAGGGWAGGGGGAGGFLTGNSSVTIGTLSVVVGAGGTAVPTGTYSSSTWSAGADSSWNSITATGGGAGATYNLVPTGSVNGGSGGGASYSTSPGTGVAGQGNNGSSYNGSYSGGGGGGAGAVGSVTDGGIGIQSSITGTATYYAGGGAASRGTNGGAAGTGGLGGGGSGIITGGPAPSGTVNTGGGGAGAYTPHGSGTSQTGSGAGGSGIVVVRYQFVPPSPAGSGGTGGPNAGGGGGGGNDGYTGVLIPYTVKVFTTSAGVSVTGSGTAEYLIVGGGGGGGSDMGGGGGAGGFLSGSTALTTGTFTVTVGAGGTGAPAGISQVRGSNGNSSSLVPIGFKGHSYNFDGSGDYLSAPSNSAFAFGTGDFTVECWAYFTSVANFPTLTDSRATTSSTAGFNLGLSTARVQLFTTSQLLIGATTLVANTWYHIAVTRSGTTLNIWLNGVQDATVSNSTNWSDTTLIIGATPNFANKMTGYISNTRIVKGTAVYTTTFTPSTTPLTAIAGTSLLTAQDLSFIDNSANNFALTATGNTASSHFSPFHELGAAGGGGGASEYGNNNSPAGSGGSGGGVASSSSVTNGLGIPGQGFAGGTSGGNYYPGGGGGAAAPGTNTPANGGAGRSSSILGTTLYWAGGGGGAGYSGIAGNGGIGGGGGGAPKVSGGGLAGGSAYSAASDGAVGTLNSQTNVPGGAGGANTGGGGGGGAHYNSNNFGGAGGSGMVIVKYNPDQLAITGGTTLIVYQLDTGSGGGRGGSGDVLNAGTTGTLGGGGGGGSSATVAGGGGGIGVGGHSSNGIAGNIGQNGGGGSGGFTSNVVGNGGLYGGGGGGTTNSTVDTAVGNGANGALKIYWAGNVITYPTTTIPTTVTNLNNSTLQTEAIESDSLPYGVELATILVRVTEGSLSNASSYYSPVLLTEGTTVEVQVTKGLPSAIKSVTAAELQIITYTTDQEMMLTTVDQPLGETVIQQVLPENDPRLIDVRLLNYIVGVTGVTDGNAVANVETVSQTQIWY